MKYSKKTLTRLIEDGELGEAIEILGKIKSHISSQERNDITLLQSRYSDLQKQIQRGIVRFDDITLTKNNLTYSTIEFIEGMEEFPEVVIIASKPEPPAPKDSPIKSTLSFQIKKIILERFQTAGGSATIPLLKKGKSFEAKVTEKGIEVSNLGSSPLLTWKIFEEAIKLMESKGGTAFTGDALGAKLGDPKLPIDSIEGHIAKEIFGKEIGKSVFRRISPIRGILLWVDVCERDGKYLRLKAQ